MKNSIITIAKKQEVKSKIMTVEIVEKGTTREETRRFGFLRQNRPIVNSNVVNFLQVINNGEYDDAFPIITVEATELLEAEYELVDLEGNAIDIALASEYLIVLDGQHRITAFSKLNAVRNEDEQIVIPNVRIKKQIVNIGEYLASINLAGHSWSTSDKICVSAIIT